MNQLEAFLKTFIEENPLLYRLILVVLILFATWLTRRYLVSAMLRGFRSSVRHKEQRPDEQTRYNFFKYLLTAFVYIVGFSLAIYSIPALRSLSASLLAGAGVLAAILGLAAQQAIANVASGTFIVIFKPYRIGDFIRVDEYIGTVEDITLRHTVVRSPANERVVIPNQVMSTETVVNTALNDEKACRLIHIGISYESSIDLAIHIIRDEATAHPSFLDNRSPEEIEAGEHPVRVLVMDLRDFDVYLRAYVWARTNAEGFLMERNLLKSIKERFDREGVVIPYPHRTIVPHATQYGQHGEVPPTTVPKM